MALFKAFFPLNSSRPKNFGSILFIRPGGIGDAVLLIASIQAIKQKYPNVSIDVLAEKRNGEVFSLCSEVSRVFRYDRPKELLSALRISYDVVIDTEQWYRLSAVIAYLTRAPIRIGFATNERKGLFTDQIKYSQDDYEVISFLRLISSITGNIPFNYEHPFLSIYPELSEKVRSKLGAVKGHSLVAIFPGGSVREKRWGTDRFRETAIMLSKKGYSIVIVGGKNDREVCKKIRAGLSGVEDFCGRLSLVETAALLKEVSLFITGDSGVMHIAYGLGTRTLSLFGPGNENKWGPRGVRHAVICKDLDCRPCTKFGNIPRCKLGVECMSRITVDEVYEKAVELLEGG